MRKSFGTIVWYTRANSGGRIDSTTTIFRSFHHRMDFSPIIRQVGFEQMITCYCVLTHLTVAPSLPTNHSAVLLQPESARQSDGRSVYGHRRLGTRFVRRRWIRLLQSPRANRSKITRSQRCALRTSLDMGIRAGQTGLELGCVVEVRAYALVGPRTWRSGSRPAHV